MGAVISFIVGALVGVALAAVLGYFLFLRRSESPVISSLLVLSLGLPFHTQLFSQLWTWGVGRGTSKPP